MDLSSSRSLSAHHFYKVNSRSPVVLFYHPIIQTPESRSIFFPQSRGGEQGYHVRAGMTVYAKA